MEIKTGYSAYERDHLDPADNMRIERHVYFEGKSADLAALTALPLEKLRELREENAAAEQAVFETLKKQAAVWEAQAGKTLAIDKAIEYVQTPEVKHTANEWEATEYGKQISNRVYQMRYRIYENTRYDREAEKSVPYSYTLSWSIYTNSPHGYGQGKIAGQERKVFADKAALEKYLNGRIKAYAHLFTEVSPPVPPEYADYFKVNGMLLPGYSIEGMEQAQPQQEPEKAAPEQTAEPTNEPQDTGQRKERDTMNEPFAILIDSRTRFETGAPGGVWLSMPTTTEQLHEAMKSVGISADNPQDFFINGYSDNENRHIALPYDMVCTAGVDELNFLAARLKELDPAELPKLNAALQQKQGFETIGQVIDFTFNVDYFVHIPEVHTSRDLGDYYLNKSGMVQMPEEWKGGVDLATFGRNAAEQEQGSFTEYGYLVKSGDEWERQFEERKVPEEYRIMSFPQEQAYRDAAAPGQETAQATLPQEPRPVKPIILTADKPREKMKEITDRLEQGITELFESERYKEYLRVMSKFHNYSFNNTVLIAMQKPDASLVAGFNAWKNDFGRNVMKGEKSIKIIAPSPFTVKREVEKTDPRTGKPLIGRDGKPVTEEKEIEVPAFRVVSVFDVSQTEGKELPDIAVDELTGDVERYKDFFTALEKTSPVPIGFEQIPGSSHGYYHLKDKRIAINEGMSELQTLKTAIHEIAHAKLHDTDLNAPEKEPQPRIDRRTREVEAESVAYTVCQHYGLDTSDYSFGYVAGWSSGKELTELKGSLETIRKTAAEIINSIDEHMAELSKAQDKEQTAGQKQPDKEEKETAPEPPKQEATTEKPPFVSESVYRVRKNPYSESREDSYILQEYVTQENGRAKLGDILYKGTPEKCRELMGKIKSGELTQGQVKELYTKAQEQPQPEKQADRQEKTAQEPLSPDGLTTGEKVKTPRGTFYVADMTAEQMKAAGYGLHHTSDDGKYLIMGNGTRAFAIAAEQPQRENPLKAAEQTTEQNENMIDGIINNTPTVDELEAKVKAGEQISLVDLANAVKADRERGKATKPEKKPSIRAQLKADKTKTAPKKTAAKAKNQEMEV